MFIFGLRNVVIGIVATVTMDVLSAVSVQLRLIAPLSPRLIGRWSAFGRFVQVEVVGVAVEARGVAETPRSREFFLGPLYPSDYLAAQTAIAAV